MITTQLLIERSGKTRHGFADLKRAASEVIADHATKDSLRLARALLASEVYQARMVATYMLGDLAARSKTSLALLRTHVSHDDDWRVQEALAQAFDTYCAATGYERALPVIAEWLADPTPNVRRAASEGLRIWTGRPYFREHPDVAIRLLSQLRNDESDYVRRSAGNALRDISRKHAALVQAELARWDLSDKGTAQTHRLAGRFLPGPTRAG